MGKLPRPAGALGVAEAQAGVAIGRLHLGEQHRDLGHRLLPAGQHLGVADRRGQRQGARRDAQPGDAVGS